MQGGDPGEEDHGKLLSELREFVSRQNRASDAIVHRAELNDTDLTLTLWLQRPTAGKEAATRERFDAPLPIFLHFGCDPPICYAGESRKALLQVVGAASARLMAGATVHHAASVVIMAAQRLSEQLWPLPLSPSREAAVAVFDALQARPTSMGLMLTLLSLAAASYRRDTVANPFPAFFETDGGGGKARKRDYKALLDVAASLPPAKALAARGVDDALINLTTPQLALLHFLLLRLRCGIGKAVHAERIAPANAARAAVAPSPVAAGATAATAGAMALADSVPSGLSGLSTGAASSAAAPAVELLVVLPPDPAFDDLARQHGCRIGYHGSPPENWHSILHNGLAVMSHGRKMRNGAAFGEGVYLAADPAVALSFASPSPLLAAGWVVAARQGLPAAAGGDIRVVAKCEVAALPEYTLHNVGHGGAPRREARNTAVSVGAGSAAGDGERGAYYIVANPAHVRLVSLMIYVSEALPQRPQKPKQATLTSTGVMALAVLAVMLAVLAAQPRCS